jgi:hypothetical protein
MGLDMYLSKKTYVKKWGHEKPEEAFEISVKKGGVTFPDIKTERVSYVTEEVAYWRKANQIHGWFVNNGEEIVPDVKYSLSREDLENLLETCKKVIEMLNKSTKTSKKVVSGWSGGKEMYTDIDVYDTDDILEILPPTQGFFFGSDNIDEWYKKDIEDTIKVLEEELSIPTIGYGAEYEYYASW